jgi:hypothetical protein
MSVNQTLSFDGNMQKFGNQPQGQGQGMDKGGMAKKATIPPSIKDGDWLCCNKNCNNINWAKRRSCHLCHTLRPVQDGVEDVCMPRDKLIVSQLNKSTHWGCSTCGNIIKSNFQWCSACGNKRSFRTDKAIEKVQKKFDETQNQENLHRNQTHDQPLANLENFNPNLAPKGHTNPNNHFESSKAFRFHSKKYLYREKPKLCKKRDYF